MWARRYIIRGADPFKLLGASALRGDISLAKGCSEAGHSLLIAYTNSFDHLSMKFRASNNRFRIQSHSKCSTALAGISAHNMRLERSIKYMWPGPKARLGVPIEKQAMLSLGHGNLFLRHLGPAMYLENNDLSCGPLANTVLWLEDVGFVFHEESLPLSKKQKNKLGGFSHSQLLPFSWTWITPML